jgi:hypothetical protein
MRTAASNLFKSASKHCFKILLVVLLVAINTQPGQAAGYAVAKVPTPVINTPDFRGVFGGKDGKSLKTDACGQVRAMEFIALPGTGFKILEQIPGEAPVYRVETEEYPVGSGKQLYIDSRFVHLSDQPPRPRERRLPAAKEIIALLEQAQGLPYVWGGNVSSGIDQLFEFSYRGEFKPLDRNKLALAGLDCSGLLYQATNGWTPRNTSQLVTFGKSVPIAGKNAAEIAGQLRPLDLIVWNGHIIIVLDDKRAIESRLACQKPGNGGVVVTPLRQRLAQLIATRRPADQWDGDHSRGRFVVRRWL